MRENQYITALKLKKKYHAKHAFMFVWILRGYLHERFEESRAGLTYFFTKEKIVILQLYPRRISLKAVIYSCYPKYQYMYIYIGVGYKGFNRKF